MIFLALMLPIMNPSQKLDEYLLKDSYPVHIQGNCIDFFGKKSELRTTSTRFPSLEDSRIAIDPGHFGGAYAELEERTTYLEEGMQLREGDMTLKTALILRDLLEKAGVTVFLTREKSPSQPYEEEIPFKKYNLADLKMRAEEINAFAPDLTLMIHYNTDRENEGDCTFTFIPGAFTKGELDSEGAKKELLRLIETDHLDKSLVFSEAVVQELHQKMGVGICTGAKKYPIFEVAPGVYARNLVLTRLVHSPLCYSEAVSMHSLHLQTAFAGQEELKTREVAEAYFEAIKKVLSP